MLVIVSSRVVTVAPPRPAAESAEQDALVREARSRQRRRQATLLAGLVLLAASAYGAYAIAAGTGGPSTVWARGRLSAAAAAACSGPATPAVTTPDGLGGARALGRVLWLSPVFLGTDTPTQVWIEARQSTTVPRVVLRGWRCSDGRLLHFWFQPPGPGDYSGSAEAVASQAMQQAARAAARLERGGGSLTATLRPRALDQGLPCGTRPPDVCTTDGAFMFSSPGKWVVQAQQGSKVVGTAVFDLHG